MRFVDPCTQPPGDFKAEAYICAEPECLDMMEHITYLAIKIEKSGTVIRTFSKSMDCDMDKSGLWTIQTPTFHLDPGVYKGSIWYTADCNLTGNECPALIILE